MAIFCVTGLYLILKKKDEIIGLENKFRPPRCAPLWIGSGPLCLLSLGEIWKNLLLCKTGKFLLENEVRRLSLTHTKGKTETPFKRCFY